MSRTILCADDSVTMQKVAEITFKASDYDFVGAKSADEALAAARSSKPALILADAVMPGKTGYDLCQAIKGDPNLKDVPVVLMCGNSQAYDPARGSSVGADGHVTKPWDTKVMLEKVDEFLSQGSSGASAGAAAAAPVKGPDPIKAKNLVPDIPAVGGGGVQPPRSATLMGMPSIQLPGSGDVGAAKPASTIPGPGVPTPAPMPIKRAPTPAPIATKPAPTPMVPPTAPKPVMSPSPIARPTAKPTPIAAPKPAPIAAPKPPLDPPTLKPSAAPIAAPKPAPSPVTPIAAPTGGGAPARAPMIGGAPSYSPVASAAISAKLAAACREAGVNPDSPEMKALVNISRDVVERIVWEVVPDLAEQIVRENLDKLARKA